MKTKKLTSARGFTIVELMIALSVLSVILVMATVILIQIGGLYTKGVNESKLQNTTRDIAADVSSSLQFSDKEPRPSSPCTGRDGCAVTENEQFTKEGGGTIQIPVHAFCLDTRRYSFILDGELGDTVPHVLWRDTIALSVPCKPAPLYLDVPSSEGYEMAMKHTQLRRFSVVPVNDKKDLYTIDVWMAYGSDDLLNRADSTGHTTCKGGVGQEFCAVSELSTSVARRLN